MLSASNYLAGVVSKQFRLSKQFASSSAGQESANPSKIHESQSFCMNLFRGRAHLDQVFPYPLKLDADRRETVDKILAPMEKFMDEVNDPFQNDADANIPMEVVRSFAEMGGLGMGVPEKYEGAGLNNAQAARISKLIGGNSDSSGGPAEKKIYESAEVSTSIEEMKKEMVRRFEEVINKLEDAEDQAYYHWQVSMIVGVLGFLVITIVAGRPLPKHLQMLTGEYLRKLVDEIESNKLEEGLKKLQEIKDCHSLLKKHLTKDVISQLKGKRTSLGASLLDVVRSGFANPDSSIGVYAADHECYETFSALFDPIIQEYHGFGPTEKQPAVDLGKGRISELAPLDKEGKYIKSTRLNQLLSHASRVSVQSADDKKNYMEVQKMAKSALESVTDKQMSGKYFPLEGMTKEVQNQLIADHFLFKEGDRFLKEANACNFWPIGRGIFHNNDKTFLVWINEEDHLRLISMQNDGNVGQVLERLIKGIESIEGKVPFARDDRLGWLTFCPTNLGTSVRASVHIALPKISKQPDFKEICDKLKLQIRGIHGEHSTGGVYDISNKARLGLTEFQAVKQMYDGVKHLIELEKKAESAGKWFRFTK